MILLLLQGSCSSHCSLGHGKGQGSRKHELAMRCNHCKAVSTRQPNPSVTLVVYSDVLAACSIYCEGAEIKHIPRDCYLHTQSRPQVVPGEEQIIMMMMMIARLLEQFRYCSTYLDYNCQISPRWRQQTNSVQMLGDLDVIWGNILIIRSTCTLYCVSVDLRVKMRWTASHQLVFPRAFPRSQWAMNIEHWVIVNMPLPY